MSILTACDRSVHDDDPLCDLTLAVLPARVHVLAVSALDARPPEDEQTGGKADEAWWGVCFCVDQRQPTLLHAPLSQRPEDRA